MDARKMEIFGTIESRWVVLSSAELRWVKLSQAELSVEGLV